MTNIIRILGVILLIFIIHSCKKEEIPTLTTSAITNLTINTATSGGNISFDGGEMITARGVCWSTGKNPMTNDNKTSDGAGEGSYSSNIINLNPGTKYYVRAYATNSSGTGYGDMLIEGAKWMREKLSGK